MVCSHRKHSFLISERIRMDKKDVIKITLELIKEKKLEKASIGEIVKRLELSPGNLYYHFKSKSDSKGK